MAVNTRDIKRRIKTFKNTEQITKAMKMVSASKLRRAQERLVQSRPYAAKMEEVIRSIAKAGGATHPMLVKRPVKKICYVVVATDRGTGAGSYNAQITRETRSLVAGKAKNDYVIFAVGRKGRDFFTRGGYPMAGEVTGLSDFPGYADIKRITKAVIPMYERGEVDEVVLVYNHFKSAISQVPVAKKILPLEDIGGETEDTEKKQTQYLYEPSAEDVLKSLLPKYAETLIFQALLEAKASEHGARMTAMSNASDNASELIKNLTLELNRARQAAITMQITEIVGGVEALK